MIGERVSIVVLTFNRRAEILRTLSRLADIDASIAIIVVDNGSTDGTRQAIAEHFRRVRVIRLPRNIGAAGRNTGVRECATPYVAFCDDDTWWLPESLLCAAAALDAHPKLAAVTARVLVGEQRRDDPTNARMASSPFPNALGVRGKEVFGLLAGASMVRRAAFLDAGGYHPRLFLGREEALLAIDLAVAGWHMAYVPDAIVCHYPSKLRDRAARRHFVIRNALWCTWLRRPLRSAWHETRKWLAESHRDRAALRDALAALHGLPWVLRERRVVPDRIERALRTLDLFDARNPCVPGQQDTPVQQSRVANSTRVA
jgi:GT2 family glycosyltransferase